LKLIGTGPNFSGVPKSIKTKIWYFKLRKKYDERIEVTPVLPFKIFIRKQTPIIDWNLLSIKKQLFIPFTLGSKSYSSNASLFVGKAITYGKHKIAFTINHNYKKNITDDIRTRRFFPYVKLPDHLRWKWIWSLSGLIWNKLYWQSLL